MNKFKFNELAIIENTVSELDGMVVKIVGIASKLPEMNVYIIELPILYEGFSHTTLTEHCLGKY